ncbi:hypothetical protein GGR26_002457 [Lewinella marina]|uniref:hypothetical protein n=1 Tax=Neolewinella marina TaxID=438751 RepID=UPI00117A8EC6|nr:hypothetical protein [Neolewinella marina]NJB86680.1 hypothetical protein [Neolewinella marina]
MMNLPGILIRILRGGQVSVLTKDIKSATWSFIRAHQVLSGSPDSIVVFSQHSVTCRALIWVAAAKEIRTVYLPHAPTANNVAYQDLPVHVAGLWSRKDREIYKSLGASGKMKVVGNPLIQYAPWRATGFARQRCKYIFAPSPYHKNELIRQIKWLKGFRLPMLHICLHPRMKKHEMAEIIGDHLQCPITFESERVASLSEPGDVIFSCSSGVALDALKNGSIVVDLTANGVRLNYYYLEDEIIVKLRDKSIGEVEQRIAGIRQNSAEYLQKTNVFFEDWMSYTGKESLLRIKSLLDTKEAAPDKLIYDRWNA